MSDEAIDDTAIAEAPQWLHWQIQAQSEGMRLDQFLARQVSSFSRSYLQKLILEGEAQCDGTTKAPSHRLRTGESVTLHLLMPQSSAAFAPQAMALDVIHESDDYCVIHKPAGLVTHPGAGHWSDTLLNGLLHRYADAASLPRAGILHRLDKDTSGLLLVARNATAYLRLGEQMAARQIKREYLAIVTASVDAAKAREIACIDAPIGRDPRQRLRMAVTSKGRAARTFVRLLCAAPSRPASLLHCRLDTGRTHQIRVHLAHKRLPLASDTLYGGKALAGIARQALHAWRLSFVAIDGQPQQFTAPLPEDFRAALQASGLADTMPHSPEEFLHHLASASEPV